MLAVRILPDSMFVGKVVGALVDCDLRVTYGIFFDVDGGQRRGFEAIASSVLRAST